MVAVEKDVGLIGREERSQQGIASRLHNKLRGTGCFSGALSGSSFITMIRHLQPDTDALSPATSLRVLLLGQVVSFSERHLPIPISTQTLVHKFCENSDCFYFLCLYCLSDLPRVLPVISTTKPSRPAVGAKWATELQLRRALRRGPSPTLRDLDWPRRAGNRVFWASSPKLPPPELPRTPAQIPMPMPMPLSPLPVQLLMRQPPLALAKRKSRQNASRNPQNPTRFFPPGGGKDSTKRQSLVVTPFYPRAPRKTQALPIPRMMTPGPS